MDGWTIDTNLDLVPILEYEDQCERRNLSVETLLHQNSQVVLARMREREEKWPDGNKIVIDDPRLVKSMKLFFQAQIHWPIKEICDDHRQQIAGSSSRPLNPWVLERYCKTMYLAVAKMIHYRLACRQMRAAMVKCAQMVADALDANGPERLWVCELTLAAQAMFRFLYFVYAGFGRVDTMSGPKFAKNLSRWYWDARGVGDVLRSRDEIAFFPQFRTRIMETMDADFRALSQSPHSIPSPFFVVAQ